MAGYAAPYIPGWDCHGLPIEFKVVQKARDLDAAEIRRRCVEFAKGFIDIQRTSFRRLGVFGDWEHPYLTMDPAYEANILRVFAKLVEDGAVYQSRKPVQWSYGAYTALAEAEIDYKEKVSPSVFVRFPLLDNPLGLKASMVIWTTTPWTLPANVGIALHPRFTYVAGKFMKDGQTETLIIVKELLDAFAQKTGWALAETIREFQGAELENCEARHPFLSRTSKIILADFVTTDTGTGAVHIAPGHGADDYNAGRQYGLPFFPLWTTTANTRKKWVFPPWWGNTCLTPTRTSSPCWKRTTISSAWRNTATNIRTAGVLKHPSSSARWNNSSFPWTSCARKLWNRLTRCNGCPPGAATAFTVPWKPVRTGASPASARGASRFPSFLTKTAKPFWTPRWCAKSRTWWNPTAPTSGLNFPTKPCANAWPSQKLEKGQGHTGRLD